MPVSSPTENREGAHGCFRMWDGMPISPTDGRAKGKIHYICTKIYDPMLEGILFDMDGVLVNNTQAHVRAFAIFCERHGVTGWRDKLATAYGMGNDDIMRRILPPELIREQGMQQLGAEKEAIYRAIYAPEIRPVAGLTELLHALRTRGLRCAVGSSGPKANVDFVLEACGIADCFDACICGDRVSRCKPDPEIYLKAAAALGLPPSRCLVFEDAPAGIESARRAGAGCVVALVTSLDRAALEPCAPDRIIKDFTELTDLETLLSC